MVGNGGFLRVAGLVLLLLVVVVSLLGSCCCSCCSCVVVVAGGGDGLEVLAFSREDRKESNPGRTIMYLSFPFGRLAVAPLVKTTSDPLHANRLEPGFSKDAAVSDGNSVETRAPVGNSTATGVFVFFFFFFFFATDTFAAGVFLLAFGGSFTFVGSLVLVADSADLRFGVSFLFVTFTLESEKEDSSLDSSLETLELVVDSVPSPLDSTDTGDTLVERLRLSAIFFFFLLSSFVGWILDVV